MRTPTIYLETTIFNFPFADDAPQYRADTLKLFEEIKAGNFKAYTSEYVQNELDGERHEEKREKMLKLITEYNISVLPPNDEVKILAAEYVKMGIIPAKYETDAQHIACATIAGLDIIVSLNFRHIVKHKTIEMVDIINKTNGYKGMFIHSPAEIIENA